MVPPGQPMVEGKEAIRAYVTASLAIPGFRVHWARIRLHFRRMVIWPI